jgi:starch synthase
MTVVDVGAVTEACCRLIEDPALRRRLGDNGLRAARDVFDWSRIVPRYQALWAELSARRAAAAPMPPRLPALMDDPFRVFAGFARARIDADTRVVASADQSEETFRHRAGVWMNRFAAERLLPEDELLRLLDACRGTPRRFGDLIEGLDGDRAAVALRSLGWLLKIDVIRIAE